MYVNLFNYFCAKTTETDMEWTQLISNKRLGLEKYRTKGADDIGEGPVYIRRSDAEEALEKRMKERKENDL